MLGRSVCGQVGRGGDDHLALRPRQRDGDHVLLDDFTEAQAGIEATGDDVGFVIGDGDIQGDMRVGGGKGADQGAGQKALGDGSDRHAQQPARRSFFRYFFKRHLYGGQGAADLLVQRLASLGQAHMAGGAVDQRNAQLVFQLAHGLADGRARHAELVGRCTEVLCVGHRQKAVEQLEFVFHWLESLTKLCSIGALL